MSKKQDLGEKQLSVEVLMPVEAYWNIEELLKKLDYLIASREDAVSINELRRKIYDQIAKFIVFESDRNWFHEEVIPTKSVPK